MSDSIFKILVFEDDQPSYDLLRVILSDKIYQLHRASNGLEGLDIFQKDSSFDLILMDIKMPLMDGIEATTEIRKFNTEIPIIAQTAFAMSGDKDKAMNAGCTDYISKPLRKVDLLEVVKRHLK